MTTEEASRRSAVGRRRMGSTRSNNKAMVSATPNVIVSTLFVSSLLLLLVSLSSSSSVVAAIDGAVGRPFSSLLLRSRGGGDLEPSSSSSSITRGTGNDDDEEEACRRIRGTLRERHEAVLSGARGRQFARGIRGKEISTVLSAHGRDEDDDEDDDDDVRGGSSTVAVAAETTTSRPRTRTWSSSWWWSRRGSAEGLFPADVTSLELVVDDDDDDGGRRRARRASVPPPSVLELTLRAAVLGLNFFPCLSTAWLALLSPSFRSRVWFRWVSRSLARSGPAFIKWGQWSSTRPDMFPEELCEALSTLHADAPSHSWDFTKSSVERALGLPPGRLGDVFETFEETPIASGSIAQVHRAALRDGGGVPLAVKVRHPRVAVSLDRDFRLMAIVASAVDSVPALSWLNVRSSVEQFSHTMAGQAWLDTEAHHLEVLNHNFRRWPHVNFPRPLFADESVILETFEKGAVVTDMMSFLDDHGRGTNKDGLGRVLRRVGDVRPTNHHHHHDDDDETTSGYDLVPFELSKFIVTAGCSTYLKMCVQDGLMHADLHPGNILIRARSGDDDDHDDDARRSDAIVASTHRREQRRPRGGSSSFRGALNIVDAGMVARLADDERTNFVGLLASLGDGDAASAADAILRFSARNDAALSEDAKEAFRRDAATLFAERCRGYGTGTDLGNVLRGVLTLVRIHRIRVDANYATLVVNALCLHGMASKFAPSYNVLDASEPLFAPFKRFYLNGGSRQRSAFAKKLFELCAPLLQMRKNREDERFFRRLRRRRRRRRQQQKRSRRRARTSSATTTTTPTTKRIQ